MEEKASNLYGLTWCCFFCSLFLPAVAIDPWVEEYTGAGIPVKGVECLICLAYLLGVPWLLPSVIANIGLFVSLWGWLQGNTKTASLWFAVFSCCCFLMSLTVPFSLPVVKKFYPGYYLWVSTFLLLSGAFLLRFRSHSSSHD